MSTFDRFAKAVAQQAARSWFFSLLLMLVIIWVPSGVLFGFGDTWHLLLNTPTTAITTLLVALLHNDQQRSEAAVNKKLDALADALSGYMKVEVGREKTAKRKATLEFLADELREAVGLEDQVSAKDK